MDLLTAFRTTEAVETAKREPIALVYVAPLPPSGVPDDGVLNYSTVETLRDIFVETTSSHCFLFSDSANSLAVLKVINDNPDIVPFNALRLEGLSSVEYSAQFMRDSWALEAEQYVTVLSAATERKHEELVAQREAAVKSTLLREQKARTRLSGHQRRHTAFDIVKPDVSEDLDVGSVED